MAGYRAHLENLDRMVAACRKARSAQGCDPAQVGPDNRLRFSASAEPREIRFEWLRMLLDQAGKEEKKEPQEAKNSKPIEVQPVIGVKSAPSATPRTSSIDEWLEQAHQRLEQDWRQAGVEDVVAAGHAAQREALKTILARREYRSVAESTWKDRLMEKFANWINGFFSRLIGFGAQARWFGWLLRGLLIGGVCLGLVWALIRIERSARLRVVPELEASAMTPSARDWQLWLQDARAMAALELWREAIHFVYWASISRLESKRLWPADRTRTPREYLALLPAEDARRANLTALTRSFERIWYGGRAAAREEFQVALELAAALGVE